MEDSKQYAWRAEFHKALGNQVRLQIVDFLMEGEQCQCEIFPKFGLAQSTVSAYLAKLVRAGILSYRKDGTRKMYGIVNPEIKRVVRRIQAIAAEPNP